ncbi:guanosine nucleotide diphosphate dissociation inhibitor 2-like [Phaseolus vulgaris]|uniref:guanosine nucleotide diphosphate dissociation inhibitor 2-like n=1 Tax=Phaseolus vulgaris TaxID=3885 RepID=UPI0035C98CB1
MNYSKVWSPPLHLTLLNSFNRFTRYLFCYSYAHNVAPKGKFIAFVTTEAETNQPEEDLKPVLGSVNEIFYDMYDRFEPCNDHEVDGCFISTSYDPTTHFEITVKDGVGMYSKITRKILDLSVDLSVASAAAEE